MQIFFFPPTDVVTWSEMQHVPLLQYVNRGLLNLRPNGCLRGKGGCGCTLNGKPERLCAVVMGGDYLAMQADWMNAPPQITCTLSLLPPDLLPSISL